MYCLTNGKPAGPVKVVSWFRNCSRTVSSLNIIRGEINLNCFKLHLWMYLEFSYYSNIETFVCLPKLLDAMSYMWNRIKTELIGIDTMGKWVVNFTIRWLCFWELRSRHQLNWGGVIHGSQKHSGRCRTHKLLSFTKNWTQIIEAATSSFTYIKENISMLNKYACTRKYKVTCMLNPYVLSKLLKFLPDFSPFSC